MFSEPLMKVLLESIISNNPIDTSWTKTLLFDENNLLNPLIAEILFKSLFFGL